MTDKDPKDMSASELLRWIADYDDQSNCRMCHIFYISDECGGHTCGDWKRDLADKIDAELAKARDLSLRQGAELWAKANGWPDFKDGEDFGAWLDRCAITRPRFEDGDPVQFGDDCKGGVIDGITVCSDGRWRLVNVSCELIECGSSDQGVRRPAPEALGADGLPIKEGETVWLADEYSQYADSADSANESEYSLIGVNSREALLVENDRLVVGCKNYVRLSTCNAWCPASFLTHTRHDTQERIDDDATMHPAAYCAAYGIDLGDDPDRATATEAMVRDLLRRQRELDKWTGGE